MSNCVVFPLSKSFTFKVYVAKIWLFENCLKWAILRKWLDCMKIIKCQKLMELNGRSSSWVISVTGQRSIRGNYIPNNNRIKLNLQCECMPTDRTTVQSVCCISAKFSRFRLNCRAAHCVRHREGLKHTIEQCIIQQMCSFATHSRPHFISTWLFILKIWFW